MMRPNYGAGEVGSSGGKNWPLQIGVDIDIHEGPTPPTGTVEQRRAAARAAMAANKKRWGKAEKAMVLELRKVLVDWAKKAQAFLKSELPAKGQGASGVNKGIAKKQVYRKVSRPDWGKNRLYARVRVARRGYIPVNYGTNQDRKTKAGYNRGGIVATQLLERAQRDAYAFVQQRWGEVAQRAMDVLGVNPQFSESLGSNVPQDDE